MDPERERGEKPVNKTGGSGQMGVVHLKGKVTTVSFRVGPTPFPPTTGAYITKHYPAHPGRQQLALPTLTLSGGYKLGSPGRARLGSIVALIKVTLSCLLGDGFRAEGQTLEQLCSILGCLGCWSALLQFQVPAKGHVTTGGRLGWSPLILALGGSNPTP